MVMTPKEAGHKLTYLLGHRNIEKKPLIAASVTPYPMKRRAIGKNKNSQQGVGGWRQQYHRPFEPKKENEPDFRESLRYNH